MRSFIFATLAASALLTACNPAFAGDGTTVALSDLLTAMVALVGGIALAIVRPLAASASVWMATHARVQLDAAQRALLDGLCYRAIQYATAQATQTIVDDQPAIDLHSQTLASAADYVLAHAPDAAAHFGLDRDGIIRMVTARCSVVSAGAASPAA